MSRKIESVEIRPPSGKSPNYSALLTYPKATEEINLGPSPDTINRSVNSIARKGLAGYFIAMPFALPVFMGASRLVTESLVLFNQGVSDRTLFLLEAGAETAAGFLIIKHLVDTGADLFNKATHIRTKLWEITSAQTPSTT